MVVIKVATVEVEYIDFEFVFVIYGACDFTMYPKFFDLQNLRSGPFAGNEAAMTSHPAKGLKHNAFRLYLLTSL